MGQAERTSKLELDLSSREQGGINTLKRSYLQATRSILDEARSFYLAFFLAHPTKLTEQVQVMSKKTGEVRQAPISADKLLSLSQNIKPLPRGSIPLRTPTGTSAPVFLLCPGNTGAR